MVCEPDNSQLLSGGIAQPRDGAGNHQTHPSFRPHLMQGWTPNFIPGLVEPVAAANNIDGFLAINGSVAMQCAMDLAQKEGIFVGTSSGATLAGALQVAEQAPVGSNILCMLPDTGERYLSTPLFDSILEDMNTEEMEISRSTTGYRFDSSAAEPEDTEEAAEAVTDSAAALDPAAQAEIDSTLADNPGKVVMFSLEWCEFCWSVRKMMDSCEIPYITVDLDSVAYQDNERGSKILDVLSARNDWPTIPQIYLGDEFVGGATDLFDIGKAGQLEAKLDAQSIPYNEHIKRDPYSFLPAWLHPR
jgi:cysteine synthase A